MGLYALVSQVRYRRGSGGQAQAGIPSLLALVKHSGSFCDVVCGAGRGRLMWLGFKSFLGSSKSSKIGRGNLSGEASEAKTWMFGMLGKGSKVRRGYGCLSGEQRRCDMRGA